MIESGIFDYKSRFQFFGKDPVEEPLSDELSDSEPAENQSAENQEGKKEPKNKFLKVVRIIFKTIYHLRGLFMAIPVIILALRFANYNSEHLPLLVGLNLQSNGEFAKTISRETAVNTPVFLTLGCLGVMCFSRKPVYPWLISLFTLAIPVLLLLTNTYPM
jgi:predicted membrane channel-forming protein YqfA (hemolysin III family)